MKIFSFAFIGLLAFSAHALETPQFEVLACPAIGDEYEKMMSKLESIKTAIKKDVNCDNLALKVKSLEDLVTKDREAVMAIVNNGQGTALTADQSKVVRDYAENVTKKVAALNDLFTRSNYCFREDQVDNQMSSLAGFVGEASQLVASLTGPWGTPIALAGNVIAGFMTGLDQIYKSRAGFDFSKRDQWTTYVNSLCTYHSYRDQITHLLEPEQRISQLRNLQTRLEAQISTMSTSCDECRQMQNTFEQQKSQSPEALAQLYRNEISAADRRFSKPYGTYMLQSLALRDWVVKETARVQREANSYWADASGRHLLSQAKADIEDFLVTREGPKFLTFGATQARQDYGDFLSFASSEGRSLYNNLDRSNREILAGRISYIGWSTPADIFRALVLQPLDWGKLSGSQKDDLQYQWHHFREQGLNSFRNAQASTQVVQTFCSFFKHAGYYSSDVRQACNSPYFTRVIEEENKLANDMVNVGISGVNPAIQESGNAYLNRIEVLTKGIEQRDLTR